MAEHDHLLHDLS